MFKEIDHKADIAYEVKAKDLDELVKDVISILLENSEESNQKESTESVSFRFPSCLEDLQKTTKKCYNIDTSDHGKFIDDFFDMVNDIILKMDSGYFPLNSERTCVYFSRKRVALRIKALTYHGLKVEIDEDISLRMVFDV